jgi:predicted RND superfamily exporter protein
MDDGPRTGALQLLLLLVGAACVYLTISYIKADSTRAALFPTLLALGCLYGIFRTERYARRRAREEAEERERRRLEAQYRQPSAPQD